MKKLIIVFISMFLILSGNIVVKAEELMMKLTEFLNKVYFLNALNGSLFLNSSLIIHHS